MKKIKFSQEDYKKMFEIMDLLNNLDNILIEKIENKKTVRLFQIGGLYLENLSKEKQFEILDKINNLNKKQMMKILKLDNNLKIELLEKIKNENNPDNDFITFDILTKIFGYMVNENKIHKLNYFILKLILGKGMNKN